MKHLDRSRSANRAATLGLSALIFCAVSARPSGARAQDGRPSSSQSGAEPTEDPGAEPAYVEDESPAQTPEDAIRKWTKAPRVAARELIGEYGEPGSFTKGSLIWRDKGPWQKIAVYRRSLSRFFGQRSKGFLEQTVAYHVPVDKIEDLKRFDGRLQVNESQGLLSSRSESEAANFLALNMADEIVEGKRSVESARNFFAKTERLAAAGKTSAYTQGLLFTGRKAARTDNSQDIYDQQLTP